MTDVAPSCTWVAARATWAPRAVAALLSLLLTACEPDPDVVTLPLSLRQVAACPVGSPSDIELVALGDFPSRSYRLTDASRISELDSLPPDAVELAVQVTSEKGAATGRRIRSDGSGEQAVWVLPDGPSCPLGDVYLRAREGTVVSPLPQGGALIVGGSETETLATSDAFVLEEGSEIGSAVEGGMLLRRAFASATKLRVAGGDVVVVAGGTADRRGSAHDNFEIFDCAAARFVAAQSGKLQQARMQHAAVRLPDERLLLIGGRAEADGPALRSVELLDPRHGSSELSAPPSGLVRARVEPAAVVLDSGAVLVLGGRDAEGQVQGSVESYDPVRNRFVLKVDDLPVRTEVVAAALPGARVAWLGCDVVEELQSESDAACDLVLLQEDGGKVSVAPVRLELSPLVPHGLKQLRMVHVGGGELLLTGADDSDPTGRRRAFKIDPVLSRMTRVDASRVPRQLLRLENGVIAELDDDGISLRAARTLGRFATPEGDLMTDARAFLVLDAPDHFRDQDHELQALQSGARVDVGELRLSGFRASIVVDGDYELLVYDGAHAYPHWVVRDGVLSAGECKAGLAGLAGPAGANAAQTLEVLRVGETLTVAAAPCVMHLGSERVGLGLRLESGSVLSSLQLQRL